MVRLPPEAEAQVLSATRFVVSSGYSHYFAEHTHLIVDVYQDGRVIVRKEISKKPEINREDVGRSVNTYKYQTVAEFKAAHPVAAKQIKDYLVAEKLRLPWVEDRSPDLQPITHKCKFCGEVRSIKEFPLKDMSFDGVHDDCCDCRRIYCKREKCFCIAPEKPQCKACPVRKQT